MSGGRWQLPADRGARRQNGATSARATAHHGPQILTYLQFPGNVRQPRPSTGNEWVPKVIINNTINLFFSTAISVLVISNRNSFRELFDKIASVYFIWEIHLHFSIGNGQTREPALCHLYRRTFIPYVLSSVALSRKVVTETCLAASRSETTSIIYCPATFCYVNVLLVFQDRCDAAVIGTRNSDTEDEPCQP